LGLLIEVYGEHEHDFETPKGVMLASKECIKETKRLNEFIDEAFERTSDNNDRVSLVKIWGLFVSMREYYDHLGMTISKQLAGKLGLMEFNNIKIDNARYVCGLKAKGTFVAVPDPKDQDVNL
jgi:hypothetical protein